MYSKDDVIVSMSVSVYHYPKFFLLDYILLNIEFNVFIKNDIMIIIYVNDLIFTKFDLAIIFWLKNALHERFEMSDLRSCIYYFDMMIVKYRHLKLLILNQNVYVETNVTKSRNVKLQIIRHFHERFVSFN
jgi:hypothetical protein